ncbi:MAG: sigma-70 family RNA polymerase sigma factor [Bacteroidota bacterium]
MQKISDHECIMNVLRGETQSFAYLVERYENQAYNLCYKTLRNNDDARECTQDAFVKAFEGLEKFRLDSQFSTWFYRIVYNVCMSRIRTRLRFTGRVTEAPGHWESAGENDGIGILDQDDRKMMLEKAYLALSASEVFLVEQYYREECSIEELAAMTGLSEANVKVRLFRARRKMQDEIGNYLKKEKTEWQL